MMSRIENAFGSGQRNIFSVMTYEIYELSNTDILEFLMQKYKMPNELNEEMSQYIISINKNGCLGEEKDVVQSMVYKLIDFLNGFHKTNLTHCLWLCKNNYVLELYGKGSHDRIDYYNESDITLSDLGMCGRLYAFSYNPKPIKMEEI